MGESASQLRVFNQHNLTTGKSNRVAILLPLSIIRRVMYRELFHWIWKRQGSVADHGPTNYCSFARQFHHRRYYRPPSASPICNSYRVSCMHDGVTTVTERARYVIGHVPCKWSSIYICIGCLRHHYVSFHNESKIKVFTALTTNNRISRLFVAVWKNVVQKICVYIYTRFLFLVKWK